MLRYFDPKRGAFGRPDQVLRRLMLSGVMALATAGGVAAQAKDTVTVAFAVESQMMNPMRYSGGADHYYMGQMFEMLVRPNAEGEMIPWLAESWAINGTAEKPILDVKLREGVTFHNGAPLTTADIEFSFSLQSDPKVSPLAQRVASIERFEVVDDLNFRLHMTQPDGNLMAAYLQIFAVPKEHYEAVGQDAFAQSPVGTGPWKFVSRTMRSELRLEAHEGYWNADHRPGVKNLVIKVIPEDITRIAAFEAGEVDWVDSVPVALVNKMKETPGVATLTVPAGNQLFVDFPAYQPDLPFHDLRVRQAIAHGFDMEAIIASVLNGQGQRYAGIGSDSVAFDPSMTLYPYDPDKARQLLAEAGYPNGFDTPCYNLITQREPNVKEVGEAIFAYLQTIGIRCQITGLEYGAWVDKLRRANGEMDGILSTMSGQGIPADPGNAWVLSLHSFVPGTGYGIYSQTSDPKADEMVKRLQQVMDRDERTALIREIATYKYENLLAGIPTYEPLLTFAWRDNIEFDAWPYPGYWRQFQEVRYRD